MLGESLLNSERSIEVAGADMCAWEVNGWHFDRPETARTQDVKIMTYARLESKQQGHSQSHLLPEIHRTTGVLCGKCVRRKDL